MNAKAAATPRPRAKAPAAQPPQLALAIQFAPQSGTCPVDRQQLRRWVRSALERDAQLTLRVVGRREGRSLNQLYRGRDYATNVLTFAYAEPGVQHVGPVQADLVICLPVVVAEARAQRKPLRDHLAHLVIHGTLHAQGWDHESDTEAEAMEAREVALLRRFRIADPYQTEHRPG